MDNASIHKSFEFQENIEGWLQQGLTIVHIAPYSPELNIIEIVWRKIKPKSCNPMAKNIK
jgi:transposase